jgi:magnesium transporter
MKPLESLLRIFVGLHPQDAARAFETLEADDALRLFNGLPINMAAPLMERLSPAVAGPMLDKLDPDRVRGVLSAMRLRAASTVVQHLSDEERERVLSVLDEPTARSLRELAKYPPDTAGAMMQPRVASLSLDMTAQEAIARIRKTHRDVLHYLYVADNDGKLVGVVTMRDLLLAAPRDRIEAIAIHDPITVADTDSREAIIDLLRERRFVSLPVVDFEGRLIGVVRRQDMLETGQLEGFENMQKLVGASADERALSSIPTVVRSRLPWLYVNLLTAFMAAAVVGVFEDTISKMAALAVLLPVVAGQGGNTGSQSLAVVMRGLALREIVPGVKTRVIRKELISGFINGIAIAVVTALCVFGWRLAAGDGLPPSTGLALVIGISMVINMVAAAGAGALIPLALQAMGRDPAQSAAIFLTTVTDIIGFAAFLGFAMLLQSLLM